jgi:antitoxin component of MazEF toxin-antitoxin module
MPKQKIIKTGNSLAVTIPSFFVKSVGVKVGQEVEVELSPETGKMIYSFTGTKQLLLSQNFINKKRK